MSNLSNRIAALTPAMRDALARRLKAEAPAREPIAIVGMACRFPGEANSPEAFWQMLLEGRDGITEAPADRWDVDRLYDPDPAAPGKLASRWGGFLRDIDQFDASFFGISPREAQKMDPQQRILLEVAWEALDDAGQDVHKLAGSDAGVFLGIHSSASDYFWMQLDRVDEFDAFSGTGSSHSIASGRLSYLWDLRGPCVVVDTACSSSLVAVHMACTSLLQGETGLAIAAGVNLTPSPLFTIALSRLHMLSPRGRCRTFDAGADGFVRSEGCGVVVLRRLSDALAAGDRIHGIIRGSAVNQDGRTNGITAPNSLSQQSVIRRALKNANVEPDEIGLVEAHGTGTALGDPIEVEALAEVFGARKSGLRCALGSAKANIGHLEGAAGIAGLIKAVLSIQRRQYPPLALFQSLNPNISLEGTPFEIPTEPRPWEQEGPRRAGVSSFGWSGTNVHLVLEEAPAATAAAATAEPAVPVLTLSARSEEALRGLARSYASALGEGSLKDAALADVCFTANARRTSHDYRAAVCGATREAMAEALESIARGDRRWDTSQRRTVGARSPRVALVFCGQGAQAPGMGTGLIGRAPAFTETMTRIDELVRGLAGWSVIDELRAAEGHSRLDQTEIVQPALFALQVALAMEWRARGIVPALVIGHSVGEIAAAHVAGVLSLEDAVRVAVHRARLMQRATGYGRMLSLPLPLAEAEALAAASGGKLSVAAENGPKSCVLSGDTAAVMQLSGELESRGISARMLPVNYAFHSRQMDPILRELREELAGIAVQPAALPIVSTVTGQAAAAGDYGPDYWVRNVRQTVRFASAIGSALGSGRTVFLEVGPHPVLASSIAECAVEAGSDPLHVASLQRGRPDEQSLAAGLGGLYTAGCAIDWSRLQPNPGRVVSLPQYPWQRQRFWIAGSGMPGGTAEATRGEGRLPGARLRSPLFDSVVFETTLSASSPAYFADHQVNGDAVFPGAGYVALASAAIAQVTGREDCELRDLFIQQPLVLHDAASRTVQTILHPQDDGYRLEICSLAGEGQAWTTHVTGTVMPAAGPAPESGAPSPLDEAAAVDPEAHYDAFTARGLAFGPAFRCAESFERAGAAARASLRLPEGVDSRGLSIHPVLLDGAFHTLWLAMPPELVEQSQYLPFTIERIRLYRALGSAARAEAERSRRISAAGDTLSGDIRLFTDRGEIAVEVQGFTMKRTEGAAAARRRQVRTWFYEPAWTPKPVEPGARVSGPWIVVGDAGDAPVMTAALDGEGAVGIPLAIGPGTGSDVGALLKKASSGERIRGIVVVAPQAARGASPESLTGAQADCCAMLTGLVQAIVASATPPLPSLWVVTRGAEWIGDAASGVDPTLDPVHATLPGLVRALRLELPDLQTTTIDLDPAAALDAQAPLVLREMRGGDEETEVAYRVGVRLARRLNRADPHGEQAAEAAGGAVRLVVPVRGVLDNLTLEGMRRRQPGRGEIEIEIKAAGLNFRDVLNALGMYPGDAGALGGECAGTVVAIGDGVSEFAVGDDVMAIGEGTLASYVTTSAQLAARKPDRLSYAEAAGIPTVFLTVYEALFNRAKLQAGERVLIHSAAGGVGLAAVQMALDAGAEVFATAGSQHKRDFLTSLGVQHVMNSRTADFAREVIDATDGAGVDVVLNSLNGEFIERSLAVVARNGRFVELGKIGIWTQEQVARFRDDIAYSILYLGDQYVTDPAGIHASLKAIGERMAAGDLQPLPITTFSLGEAAGAFRYMAQAHHIGKIVLTPAQAAGALVRSDASYLVTGGLGALGLAVAEWLVSRGARHVVLASRHAPAPAQQQAIAHLGRSGARVTAMRCDVANAGEVAALMHALRGSGPALRGIVHAAGVLDDGVALQQTRQRFSTVLGPKVAGAINLCRAAEDDALDFVVFFSSIASVLGSPGQSNYAAANAYLDAFARELRAGGVPACSVSWGPWAGGGMAASADQRSQQRWADQGMAAITRDDGVVALEMAIASGMPHAGVLQVDWERYAGAAARSALQPLIGHLLAKRDAPAAPAGRPPALIDRLRRAPAAQRRTQLQQHVRERALKVLGLAPTYPLDPLQGLRDVGLDSLLAIELRNALQGDVSDPLPATLAFDYPTVEALTAFLASGSLAAVLTAAPPAAAAAPAAAVAELAELSEEEAEAILLKELSGIATDGRS